MKISSKSNVKPSCATRRSHSVDDRANASMEPDDMAVSNSVGGDKYKIYIRVGISFGHP